MPEQRDTAANRLDHVIMIIQLGRQTGTLSVERGADTNFEEGWISFIDGQITWARVGQREHEASLDWLKLWGPCRFAFLPSSTSEVRSPTPSQQHLPAGYPQDSSHEVTRSSAPDMYSRLVEETLIKSGEEEPSTSYVRFVAIPYRTMRIAEGLLVINRLGFPRGHRHIFLLIDGHRMTRELADLIGRRLDELLNVLSDLEKAGVIHQQQIKLFPKGR